MELLGAARGHTPQTPPRRGLPPPICAPGRLRDAGPQMPPPAGEILVRFRDGITNWAQVKAAGHLEGWDDTIPAYLWTGVVLDFDLRVREM